MNVRPAKAPGSAGIGSPPAASTRRHGTPRASRYQAKYPGPSVGLCRKIAIGFISGSCGVRLRDFIATLAIGLALAAPAAATDVTVVGLSNTRASVSINGGSPRWLSVGQRSPEGVLLVAADRESATVEIDGKRRTLKMNQAYVAAAGRSEEHTSELQSLRHLVC